MSNTTETASRLARWRRIALVLGLVGTAAWLVGAVLDWQEALRSYLVPYMLVLGFTLGGLGAVMLNHVVAGRWTFSILRLAEAGSRNMWLMVVLFLPILFGLRQLYPWLNFDLLEQLHGEEEAAFIQSIVAKKTAYLNLSFFLIRAVAYFVIWIGLAVLLNKWSLERDRNPSPELNAKLGRLSAAGLILYILTMTFAATDWVMSLEPAWFSTIYGALFVMGQGMSFLAIGIVTATALRGTPPLGAIMTTDRFHDLGKMLLGFVVLWAYMAFSQWLIIYSGHIAEEIPWFMARWGGGLEGVAMVLILFQFAVPFLLLLSRPLKRTPRLLSAIAVWCLLMRVVDLYYVIIPAFHPNAVRIHWTLIAGLVGLTGLWFAGFFWQLGRRPLVAEHDPRFEHLTAKAEAASHV
jgi:hypothetical protein